MKPNQEIEPRRIHYKHVLVLSLNSIPCYASACVRVDFLSVCLPICVVVAWYIKRCSVRFLTLFCNRIRLLVTFRWVQPLTHRNFSSPPFYQACTTHTLSYSSQLKCVFNVSDSRTSQNSIMLIQFQSRCYYKIHDDTQHKSYFTNTHSRDWRMRARRLLYIIHIKTVVLRLACGTKQLYRQSQSARAGDTSEIGRKRYRKGRHIRMLPRFNQSPNRQFISN